MVVFDSSVLLYVLEPDAQAPVDRETQEPIQGCKERIDYYLESLSESETRILIPTPALSEVLVGAGENVSSYLNILTSEYAFKIADFDTRAAVEVAFLTDQQFDKEISDQTKAKIKYDRQIIAIAKVNNADRILVDDEKCQRMARASGLEALSIGDLPLPPEPPQHDLPLEDRDKDD